MNNFNQTVYFIMICIKKYMILYKNVYIVKNINFLKVLNPSLLLSKHHSQKFVQSI
jgi:hypothetical protein